MFNYCPNCGMKLSGEQTSCRACGHKLPGHSGGFLSRLFGALRAKPVHRNVTKVVTTRQLIRIKDPKTGQVTEYHSLDELPPELRQQVAAAESELLSGTLPVQKTYKFRDPSGVERTYNSPDEMPPDVRALIEKAGHQP